MKILFGLFLIAHGLIHASFTSAEPPSKPGAPAWPFHLDRSWLLSQLGFSSANLKTLGTLLVILTVLGFMASGLAWLGVPGLKNFWIPVTAFSSIISLVLLLIYWNNWFVLGPVINLALLYLIFFKNWAA